MKQEIKNCQSCSQEFRIEPEDFVFYEKMKVPPPTFCPECRLRRRLIFRNERTLYERKCDLCKKVTISLYSPDSPYKVYCRTCYVGDKWDPLKYGQDMDFSRPFMNQFKELQLKTPRLYAFVTNNINSPYTNGSAFNKNCYLIFVSDHNEDSLYSYSIYDCKNTLDCLNSNACELCCNSITCKKCYQVHFSQDCSNSQNLYFCKGCVNCHDCLGSVNLRNKKYHIFNKAYSKEEYLKKIKEFNLGSYKSIIDLKNKSQQFWPQFIVKYIHGQYNNNVLGDYIFNSKNSFYSYDSEAMEDCKYINHGNKIKNCYDGYVTVDNSQFSYEIVSAISLNNVKFSYCAWHNYNLDYCDTCENSNDLFGCIGLRKKQYCILNKQYSKQEYEKLVPKIIQQMNDLPYTDKKGRVYKYGEFFPSELSPFTYNETAAQEYFPLTREQALKQGYLWKDLDKRDYEITIKSQDLPNHIKDVKDDILNQVIGCEHQGKCNEQCTTAFRIIPEEFQFYKKMNIPLPRLCPNCRHYQRLKQRNPLKLWSRKCQCVGGESDNKIYQNTVEHFHQNNHCPNEFETSYAPEKKEIVYCEKCYQTEVV